MTTKLLPLLITITLLVGCSPDTSLEPSQQPPAAASEEQQTLSPTESREEFTHVITTDTAYYTTGPQQARPPDGTLEAGTKVRVIEDAGSYCRVETEDEVIGFVVVDVVATAESESQSVRKED